MIKPFVKAFFSREEVEAVVLSGSRTGFVRDRSPTMMCISMERGRQ
jgi:predicted TIM-barrel enzyme